MNQILNIVICALIFLASAKYTQAYLDPGSGSYIFQIILAAILGAAFSIKIFFARIKLFFARTFSKKKDKDYDNGQQ